MTAATSRNPAGLRIDWAWLAVALAALLYLGLRVAAWSDTVLLDDLDSTAYMQQIEAFRNLDWDRLDNPDMAPVYPGLAAFVLGLTGEAEWSARLTSLAFSLLLAAVAVLFTRRLAGTYAAAIALLLLAVNGMLLSLSVAILTEITYIAIVFAGAYLVWRQVEHNTLTRIGAVVAGSIFGLAFLARTEGILYLVAIPLAVLLFALWPPDGGARPSWRRVAIWNIVFVTVFSVLATPQIVYVSSKMGAPAINGRVAWQALISRMPDRSTDAAIFGLDFSDAVLNIVYIKENYKDAVAQLGDKKPMEQLWGERMRISRRNVKRFVRRYLPANATLPGMALALGGGLVLYRRRRYRELAYLALFGASVMAAPIAHTNVLPRHIAILLPLLCLLQAIGVQGLFAWLVERGCRNKTCAPLVGAVTAAALVAINGPQLAKALNPPSKNKGYDPAFIAKPVAILRQSGVKSVSAQRGYIAYLSGTEIHHAPFVEYPRLLRYLELNEVEMLYVDFDRLRQYPFLDHFLGNGFQPDFERVWVGMDSGKPKAALFRRKP